MQWTLFIMDTLGPTKNVLIFLIILYDEVCHLGSQPSLWIIQVPYFQMSTLIK